jgi:hypothetical protein
VRLIGYISIALSDSVVGAAIPSGDKSVWARDLAFGAWNFHDMDIT